MREPRTRCTRGACHLPATTGSADEPPRDYAADARRVRGIRLPRRCASSASSRASQPEVRWDQPGARLMAVVTNGFLQSRMIRRDWKPGLMHAVIFLGFMALLARKLQLIVIGYHEPFVYPGLAGGLVRGAEGRRRDRGAGRASPTPSGGATCVKPARLEANREALLILSLILAIMVTDLAVRRLPLRAVRRRPIRASPTSATSRSPGGASPTRCPGCRRRRCSAGYTLLLLGAARRRASRSS